MKKTIKTYEEDGIKLQFASKELLKQINQRKYYFQSSGKKTTKAAIMNEIADLLCVSVEAVKNWMYGYNGPSDVEQVKPLANYFDIDYHQLLEKEESGMEQRNIGIVEDNMQFQMTKNTVRDIYHAMLDYIDRCRYYFYVLDKETDPPIDKKYKDEVSRANEELRDYYQRIFTVLEYGMLDLPMSFYDEVYRFIWIELYDLADSVATSEEVKQAADETELGFYDQPRELLEQYLKEGYLEKLRELFKDYIVQ